MKIRSLLFALIIVSLIVLIVNPSFRTKSFNLLGVSEDFLGKLNNQPFFPEPLRVALDKQGRPLTELGVLGATNDQRDLYGKSKLKMNEKLNQAARAKLKDLFEQQYFEHISPQGVGPSDLAKRFGYEYVVVGENLALGNFNGDQDVVEAWMNSPGHRANILNTKYQEIGIAVGQGKFEGHNTWIAVQSFGLPLSACPAVDRLLQTQIQNYQSQVDVWQSQLQSLKEDIEKTDKNNRELYNAKVQQFNELVVKTNILIQKMRTLVSQYNSQADNFNKCLKD